MFRVFLTAVVVLLSMMPLAAVDAIGTFKSLDVRTGRLFMHAGGLDRSVRLSKDVEVLGRDGQTLPGGLAATELRAGVEITVTMEGDANERVITVIRLGRAVDTYDRPSLGLIPLTEMTGADRYKGEDGGLYGAGRNEPPPGHAEAARRETARIEPLDADGRPAPTGTIAVVSIGMSPPLRAARPTASQEFSLVRQLAEGASTTSPRLAMVDGVQGSQAMAQWADPQGSAWLETNRRLQASGVSPQQVQVAWITPANIQPSGGLLDHGRRLQRDTLVVLQNARRCRSCTLAALGAVPVGGWHHAAKGGWADLRT